MDPVAELRFSSLSSYANIDDTVSFVKKYAVVNVSENQIRDDVQAMRGMGLTQPQIMLALRDKYFSLEQSPHGWSGGGSAITSIMGLAAFSAVVILLYIFLARK